jgi:hypothetical protein
MIYLHPNWVAKAGVGDIVRHFQMRGFAVSNEVGSRFFHVEPHPSTPKTVLDETVALFRPSTQGVRS